MATEERKVSVELAQDDLDRLIRSYAQDLAAPGFLSPSGVVRFAERLQQFVKLRESLRN